jgi:hypothetical protein
MRAVVRDERHRPIAVITFAFGSGRELDLGIVKVEHFSPDEETFLTEDFPLAWALEAATERGTFLTLLDQRNNESDPSQPLPMLLPPAMVKGAGRKPDNFYERVAYLVRFCAEHGIAHGPRLAKDNGVEESTVYRWVHEARRRGLLEESPR